MLKTLCILLYCISLRNQLLLQYAVICSMQLYKHTPNVCCIYPNYLKPTFWLQKPTIDEKSQGW